MDRSDNRYDCRDYYLPQGRGEVEHLILDERETSASVSETGSVIVLDPGHGGVDRREDRH